MDNPKILIRKLNYPKIQKLSLNCTHSDELLNIIVINIVNFNQF